MATRDARVNSTYTPYTGADNLEVMKEAHNYNAWLLALVQRYIVSGYRVLDFGAGSGTFAAPLHRAGLTVTCVELDPTLAAGLREQGLPVVGDLGQVEDSLFDLIYSLNVLEHIEDDCGAIRGILAKLKPGGRLLLYVPAFNVLFGPMDRKVGHLRRYRRRELITRVRAAGLTVESARYADSLGFLAALALRWLGRRSGILDPRTVRLYDRLILPVSLACDRVLWPLFGKNLCVVAHRPVARNSRTQAVSSPANPARRRGWGRFRQERGFPR